MDPEDVLHRELGLFLGRRKSGERDEMSWAIALAEGSLGRGMK
jgi:hypothetical protein